MIHGASLDVFEEEPLPKESKLWDMDNVLMDFHDADYTYDFHKLAVDSFIEELENYFENRPFKNKVDITKGY